MLYLIIAMLRCCRVHASHVAGRVQGCQDFVQDGHVRDQHPLFDVGNQTNCVDRR